MAKTPIPRSFRPAVSTDYSDYLKSSIENISSPRPIIITVGAGTGHVSVLMHDFAIACALAPISIAVDNDIKKFTTAKDCHKGRFECVSSFSKVHDGKIAYIIDEFPKLERMIKFKNKVDFMICNDIIMGVRLRDLQGGLKNLTDLLKPEGSLLLGFSTNRPKQYRSRNSFRHKTCDIDRAISEIIGVKAVSLENINDKTRPFSRDYRLIRRIS